MSHERPGQSAMDHRNPFLIIPWDRDFFTILRDRIVECTQGRPERALVIFPHDRPRRYLHDCFAADGAAMFLPRALAVRELFAALRPSGLPLREAGLIDRVALLYTCCREVSRDGDSLGQRLIRGGESAFFPWGERLDALLEECLSQDVTPTDLQHAETEVAPFGADLLAALGRIFTRYVELLPQRGRTTPGLDAYLAVRDLGGELPPLLRDKTIVLAGFHMLTGTEERLFRLLWSQGAQILLHSDPALAEDPARAHWSCAGHRIWLEKWHARALLACPPSGSTPNLHFFSGHDLHSQLRQLAEDLTEDLKPDGGEERRAPSRAVALTHPELLLPVLHHLPEKRCNVSLGYPLERTTLYRLLECVLQLAETRTDEGLVSWREFSELACHPWLRLLRPPVPDDGPGFSLLLHALDARIRDAQRFQNPENAAEQALDQHLTARGKAGCRPGSELPQRELLHNVLQHTLYAWSAAATLADTADCLAGLAELLATAGQDVWERFPLDGECLMRLVHNVIPPLRDNDLAETPLPMDLRHAMLRALLRAERVPFEADPITGLQVLGMLETRLLHFSRVYVMDATDGALPGPPNHDPLLPDSLRAVLGLPDVQHREQLAAHTFHRLLAGADEVFLYWQEGAQSSGLMDSVSQRSRLVEALIWEEEQRRHKLLKPGDPPLRTAAMRLRPPRRSSAPLARSGSMRSRMAAFLARPVSATSLDDYLRCPLRFYYSRLIGLRGRREVPEGDEPVAVGELLHAVLQEAYAPFEGGLVSPETLTAADLETLFIRKLEESPLPASLPPESLVMLSLSGPERLRRYLRSQPEKTRILTLEREVSLPVALCGEQAVLRGRMDRVDQRDDGIWVLDYKTGRVRRIADRLWRNADIWRAVQLWLHAAQACGNDPPDESLNAQGNALLLELAGSCQSVQLPCYIAMYRAAHPDAGQVNAAYVNLADKGEEVPLFDPRLLEDTGAALNERIALLLAFLLRHMRSAGDFVPHSGTHCSWCSFKNLCMLPQQS